MSAWIEMISEANATGVLRELYDQAKTPHGTVDNVVHQHWRAIMDFQKLHYALSERRDSNYWRDHSQTESVPESLQHVLYGMGFVTDIKDVGYRQWKRDAEIPDRLIRESDKQAQTFIASLPSNRDLLNRVCRN